MNDGCIVVAIVVAVCVGCYALGLMHGSEIGNGDIKRFKLAAIQYGYAEHNRLTGEWEWVVSAEQDE